LTQYYFCSTDFCTKTLCPKIIFVLPASSYCSKDSRPRWLCQVSISSTLFPHLFVQKCFLHLYSNYSLSLQFFGPRILAQKLLIKCWWNWPQGVNFINVLQAAFTWIDLKSAKKNDDLTVFYGGLGPACTMAACKMLMKLTTECTKSSTRTTSSSLWRSSTCRRPRWRRSSSREFGWISLTW